MQVVANEAGVDEAGCGSLIGPLVAAAVVLPPEFDLRGIADSKKLSASRRNALHDRIVAGAQTGIGVVTLDEINRIPFGDARRLVFQRAVAALCEKEPPASIVIDGTHFFDGFRAIPYELIAKADATHASVAAASIVAKTQRDRMIVDLCTTNAAADAVFHWSSNMGYPTAVHLAAIRENGITMHHRKHFAPCARATKARKETSPPHDGHLYASSTARGINPA